MCKRISILIFLLVTIFLMAFTACADKGGHSSNDVSLTVESVCDVEIKGEEATLMTAQYETLLAAEDKTDLCEYVLAVGAGVSVLLNENALNFTVTAEDGTQMTYTVALTVLSNDVSFVLLDVCGASVSENSIIFTETQFNTMCANVEGNSSYLIAQGAILAANYDADTASIVYSVISEDRTEQVTYAYSVEVSKPFGSHSISGYGDAKYVEWEFSERSYILQGNTALLNDGGDNLSDYYIFSCDVAIKELAKDCEVVFMAYQQDDLMIRSALRGESSDTFKIFSDYRDRSSFKNYTEHLTDIVYSEGEFI